MVVCRVGAPNRKSRGSFFDTAVARSEYASSGLLPTPICSLLRCANSSRNSSCHHRAPITSARLRERRRAPEQKATCRLVASPTAEEKEKESTSRRTEPYVRECALNTAVGWRSAGVPTTTEGT